MSSPRELASNFIVMNAAFDADVVPVGDDFYQKLGERYGDFAGHMLVSSHSFTSDWTTWEMHPSGDEVVVLTSGAATMVFAGKTAPDDAVIEMDTAGQFIVVPKGTWHTAKVQGSASMLFLTPGEGTENSDQPVRDTQGS